MARYIDAEKIEIRVPYGFINDGEVLIPMAAVSQSIARTPTADVAEVVRCKDCKNRNTPDCAMWYRCMDCDGQWSWETDNDFCSYGERK